MNRAATVKSVLHRATIALAIAAAAACGGDSSSVTGPPTGNRRVAIGDTVSGSSASGAPSVHSFTAATGQTVALQVAVSNLFVRIVITDSSTGTIVVDNTVLSPVDLNHGVTGAFNARNAVYVVTATPDPGQTVSYRYVITLVRSDPEVAPAQLTYGQAVTEPMSNAADVDDFLFDGTKDDEVILFLQGLEDLYPGVFTLTLTRDSTATVLGTVRGHNADPDPQSNTSGRIILPSTGRYRIHIVPDPDQVAPYVGNYRLELDKINRAPEHGPAAITPGDSVAGEAIEMVGDIDDFKLTAAAGEEYNVFLQAATGPASNALIVEVLGPASNLIESAPSVGTDTLQLLQNGVSRFMIPSAGTYTVRVRGQSDLGGLNRGGYRIYVHKVNRHPETIPASPRVLGDTVTGESIEVPGDVDEVPLTIGSLTLIHVETWRYAGPNYTTLTTELRRASDDSLITFNNNYLDFGETAPKGNGTLTQAIAPGSYVLRVFGDSRRLGYRGAWRAIFQKIDSMPEGRSMLFAGGDTVTGTIDPPGDIDVYRMAVHHGEHWQVFAQNTYNGGNGTIFTAKTDSALFFPDIYMEAIPSIGLPDGQHTGRVDVVKDQDWQVAVIPKEGGLHPENRGPYRFTVLPFSGVPEHHAAIVAPGDSIIDEPIDFAWDLDQFTISGAPGQECIVDLRGELSGSLQVPIWVRVIDPATHDVMTEMRSFIALQTTHRFRLPASGQALLEVLESGETTTPGPYYVKIVSINRTPETLPAAYVVGDTASGESVEYGGDIDEFTFSGIAGQQVRLYLEVPIGDHISDGIRAEISVAGSDASLGSITVQSPDLLLNNGSAVIVLPVTGTYVVRVRESNENLVGSATPYRFAVVNVP